MDSGQLMRMAPAMLASMLPKRVELSREDEVRIRLPQWRHEEIEQAIVTLYEKIDARFVPLEPLAIAQALGYGPIPYRALGPKIWPLLHAASPDALTCWFFGQETPLILYDDRQPSRRCVFSMMHEIGHAWLGHREHSKLAEIEANKFASAALCPLPLLDRSGLLEEEGVVKYFGVSVDCARLRLEALARWRSLPVSHRNRAFGKAVLSRLRFKVAVQGRLFALDDCG